MSSIDDIRLDLKPINILNNKNIFIPNLRIKSLYYYNISAGAIYLSLIFILIKDILEELNIFRHLFELFNFHFQTYMYQQTSYDIFCS